MENMLGDTNVSPGPRSPDRSAGCPGSLMPCFPDVGAVAGFQGSGDGGAVRFRRSVVCASRVPSVTPGMPERRDSTAFQECRPRHSFVIVG